MKYSYATHLQCPKCHKVFNKDKKVQLCSCGSPVLVKYNLEEKVAKLEGAFICPEGAATFAAARQLRENGWIKQDETVICLNTGQGVKYPNTLNVKLTTLEPGETLSNEIIK